MKKIKAWGVRYGFKIWPIFFVVTPIYVISCSHWLNWYWCSSNMPLWTFLLHQSSQCVTSTYQRHRKPIVLDLIQLMYSRGEVWANWWLLWAGNVFSAMKGLRWCQGSVVSSEVALFCIYSKVSYIKETRRYLSLLQTPTSLTSHMKPVDVSLPTPSIPQLYPSYKLDNVTDKSALLLISFHLVAFHSAMLHLYAEMYLNMPNWEISDFLHVYLVKCAILWFDNYIFPSLITKRTFITCTHEGRFWHIYFPISRYIITLYYSRFGLSQPV